MWVEHDGHFPPKGVALSTMVRVRFRDGEEPRVPDEVKEWGRCWTWDRRFPSECEIVAYRVAE